ncbi:oxysterol-binding protein 1-like [Drosophila navojoa]|nr:oxysterol-binding protein 1-like [Drosophila navojoa]
MSGERAHHRQRRNSSSVSMDSAPDSRASSPSNKLRLSQKKRRSRSTNRTASESNTEMKGWLLKWTNYVKGYQRRWFVLSNGVLSYYLDQSEVHLASRGSITLKAAVIEHVDPCTFAISDSSKQLSFRVKAETEAERQTWITSIELAKGAKMPAADKENPAPTEVKMIRNRRTRVPDKPHYPLSLWTLMKNCIGKDLSKIPMPINFNEPLSMLQRLVEDYEYSDVLDIAASCSDECEQLAYLAAFTVSAYATAETRINKPFNPLLGETYECDRTDDLGWRCLTEQVSHHPPITALHCESKEWVSWQQFSLTSKFRGKYLQVNPVGGAFVSFPATGRRYFYRRVTTTVNNIIVGKLWVDLEGQLEIVGSNAAKGYKCILNYIPYSYFGREEQRSIKGVVLNPKNEAKWLLRGTWNDKVEIAPVLHTSGPAKNPSYTTGEYRVAWQRRPAAPDSDKYYNLPVFACQLNEPEEGVAPTDSRLRPDQRCMEEGAWDESNREKLRLEEKQRAVRKQQELKEKQAIAEGRPFSAYKPMWFKLERVEGSTEFMHVSKNTYWQAKAAQDWSGCPNIF